MMANEACNRFGTNYCTRGRRHSVHIVKLIITTINLTMEFSSQDLRSGIRYGYGSDRLWLKRRLKENGLIFYQRIKTYPRMRYWQSNFSPYVSFLSQALRIWLKYKIKQCFFVYFLNPR